MGLAHFRWGDQSFLYDNIRIEKLLLYRPLHVRRQQRNCRNSCSRRSSRLTEPRIRRTCSRRGSQRSLQIEDVYAVSGRPAPRPASDAMNLSGEAETSFNFLCKKFFHGSAGDPRARPIAPPLRCEFHPSVSVEISRFRAWSEDRPGVDPSTGTMWINSSTLIYVISVPLRRSDDLMPLS
jgi:hypothetical protein